MAITNYPSTGGASAYTDLTGVPITSLAVVNSDAENTTNEIDLVTVTVPAGTWEDGERIEVFFPYNIANNTGNTRTANVWVKVNDVKDSQNYSSLISSSIDNHQHVGLGFRREGSTIRWHREYTWGGHFNTVYTYSGLLTGEINNTVTEVFNSIDFTSDVTLKFSIQISVADPTLYVRAESITKAIKYNL